MCRIIDSEYEIAKIPVMQTRRIGQCRQVFTDLGRVFIIDFEFYPFRFFGKLSEIVNEAFQLLIVHSRTSP